MTSATKTEKRILVEGILDERLSVEGRCGKCKSLFKEGELTMFLIPSVFASSFLCSKCITEVKSGKLEAQIQREVLEGLREKVKARITELEKSKAECMADDETLWTPDYEGRLMEAKLIQKLVESVRNSRR